MIEENTISNLSKGFLENALWHISMGKREYLKNCEILRKNRGHRKLISYRENRHSTSSILNSYTAIEFIITTESFHRNLEEFSSDDNVIKKTEKLGIISESLVLALTELSISRDTISHSYLWKTQRTCDDDYNIIEIKDLMWEKYCYNLKRKYKDNINLGGGVTSKFLFNIIPDRVDFLDSVKALYLVNEIYTHLLKNSNTLWRPQFFPYKQDGFSEEVYNKMNKKCLLKDWLDYFISNLCAGDLVEFENFIKELR
jgi:hypothetical protein